MKKRYLLLVFSIFAVGTARAQTKDVHITEHDPAVATRDSLIKMQIIDSAVLAAGNAAPDWAALTTTIRQRYDSMSADRTVTTAKIYYYYGKDWSRFTATIVHYTDNYEEATNYPLLNKNANFILKFSVDPTEWKAALAWNTTAMHGDPNNDD